MNKAQPRTQPLLIELGTEELPPKALKSLSTAFTDKFVAALADAGLLTKDAEIKSYAAPRRLAIWISNVLETQADFSQTRKGPAVKAAYDENGEPSKAAQGFAKSCGVDVADLAREKTDKGEWLVFEQTVRGKAITECAQAALDTTIAQLPIPKRMRWGDKNAEFVRPVHWLLALYGKQVLKLTALELSAGNTSKGHRFHHPDAISIAHASDYEKALEAAYVIADYAARQSMIKARCHELAKQAGGEAILSVDLLDEVTALVEWPVPILGVFKATFLEIPREALIASMKDHQKYFHLVDAKGNLLPKFITVSNIESRAPEKVLSGNERVLNARLADAQFFWEQDKQQPLEHHQGRLENLLFHIKLGSMADKTRRLEQISEQYAKLIGADGKISKRAASLCKLDLLSNMVGEFASLQGTMGRYYAQLEGEDAAVSKAIEQHYWPKFAGDQLPDAKPALVLALADRLDLLIGIFATGEKPSGVKDPYALRRAALGVIRILIENKLDLSIEHLTEIVINAYAKTPDVKVIPDQQTQSAVNQFILDRLRSYYTGQGFDIHAFNSVAATQTSRPYDFDLRLRAVVEFFGQYKSAATALAAANKRIANILRQNPSPADSYNQSLLKEDAELALANALQAAQKPAMAAFAAQQYTAGLAELAQLEQPVNTFFDEVRVIVDDQAMRDNRLGLLKQMRTLFLQVADISHLNVED